MSDYIPFDLQVEIIKRLPVKSLIQFRSVSKPWKAFIDSHEFISGYGVHYNKLHRLILRYEETETVEKYISFTDDHDFPRHMFSPTLPDLIKLLVSSVVVGSSHGLLCLYGSCRDLVHSCCQKLTKMVVLWNPSIRKSIGVVVPNALPWPYVASFGFGVCPETNDPIIVKISYVSLGFVMNVPWVVNVFTLSSGKWRGYRGNLPRESIKLTESKIVIGKLIYWFAYDRVSVSDGKIMSFNLLISFDMTSKELRVVDLPYNLSHKSHIRMFISKVHDSLAVLEYGKDQNKQVCDVWVMEDGVINSFTKLFTINSPYLIMRILRFRNNGQLILEGNADFREPYTFVLYESYSKEFFDLEIHGFSFSLSPYVETLLMLNQLDGRIYSHNEVRDDGMIVRRRVKRRRAEWYARKV